jgi:gluconokinase
MHVLALDIGTSSCRAARCDDQGRRIRGSLHQRNYPLHTDAGGRAELDPATVLRAVQACLSATVASSSVPVAAVGMSCFWHSLLGVDRHGDPATAILTWADSRSRGAALGLREQHDEQAWHARTGCMLRTSFWPAKLAWLAGDAPRVLSRVVRWLSPADWLTAKLIGTDPLTIPTAHGMATACGLYDPNVRGWDPVSLAALALDPARLPVINDLALDAQRCRWRSLRAVPWFPAIGDGAAHSLGAGAVRPGVAAINVGTSAAIRLVRRPQDGPVPFGLFRYRIDADRELVGGAISNAGGLHQWCVDHLRLPSPAKLERVLAARPGPQAGLRVNPSWLAERAPDWCDDPGGAIHGITQDTTAVDLYQAITEASYQRLARILALLPRPRGLRARVSGGVQRSPQALQRLADVLGIPLEVSAAGEWSLRGAAVLAWERLGRIVNAPVATGLVRPDARRQAAFQRAARADV